MDEGKNYRALLHLQKTSPINFHRHSFIYCSHNFHGTIIFTADCVDGEVRLMEGKTELEGRLDVCFGQRWGTISSDGWAEINSRIVCSDLGYDLDNGIIVNYCLQVWGYNSWLGTECVYFQV